MQPGANQSTGAAHAKNLSACAPHQVAYHPQARKCFVLPLYKVQPSTYTNQLKESLLLY